MMADVQDRADWAVGRPGSGLGKWGRGFLWVVAVSFTAVGLKAALVVAGGDGFAASVAAARGAASGIALLTWLLASGSQRRDTTRPRHRAAALALAAAVGSDLGIGLIVGSIVLAATPLVLGCWGLHLTWTIRRLMNALEASAAWRAECVR